MNSLPIILHPVGYKRGLDDTSHMIIGTDVSIQSALSFFIMLRRPTIRALNRWDMAWKRLANCDLRLPVYFHNHHDNDDMWLSGFDPVFRIEKHVVLWDPIDAMAMCLFGRNLALAASRKLRPAPSPLVHPCDLWRPIPRSNGTDHNSAKLLDVIGTYRTYPFAPLLRIGTNGPIRDEGITRAWMRSDGRAYPIGGSRGKYVLDGSPIFDVYSSHGRKLYPSDLEYFAREADITNRL